MNQDLLNHWNENKDTFNFWIKRNEKLQYSHPLLKIIIPEFNKAQPHINITGCADCLVVMLLWLRNEVKKHNNE